MPDSRELVQQVAQKIAASKTTSPTPPGQTDKRSSQDLAAHKEAINQIFTLFMLNYHNQFHAAYPKDTYLDQVKRLWLDALADYPVEQLLRGAKCAIEQSEYLPTLNRMLECCQQGLAELGLPSPYDAFVEACRASSPKSAQHWSHPAVYLAGRDSDWFFLANNTERTSWPVFKEHYDGYCTRVLRGETLEVPAPAALEQIPSAPLSADEQLSRIRELRRQTGL